MTIILKAVEYMKICLNKNYSKYLFILGRFRKHNISPYLPVIVNKNNDMEAKKLKGKIETVRVTI